MFQMAHPNLTSRLSLLDAITAMGLAATIHRTDLAVQQAGFRVLWRLDVKYQPVVLAIMNAPSPLEHMQLYLGSMPQHILDMPVRCQDRSVLSLAAR